MVFNMDVFQYRSLTAYTKWQNELPSDILAKVQTPACEFWMLASNFYIVLLRTLEQGIYVQLASHLCDS